MIPSKTSPGPAKTFISRALLARLAANRIYQKSTLRLALGRPLDEISTLPLKRNEMRWIAWLNIFTQAAWIAFYAWLISFNPTMAIFCIVLPVIALIVIGLGYQGMRGPTSGSTPSRALVHP